MGDPSLDPPDSDDALVLETGKHATASLLAAEGSLMGVRAVPDLAVVPLLLVWVRISFEAAVVLVALAAVVVAEWFVAESGVGVLLLQGMTNGQPALTFAAAVVLFGLGLGLFGVVAGVQRRTAW